MILQCTCSFDKKGNKQAAEYQDSYYGQGKRVHNKLPKPHGTAEYRCTICKTERKK